MLLAMKIRDPGMSCWLNDADLRVVTFPIKRSISNDRITCLECGVTLKTLRNHLRSAHGLTDQQYRDKWRLPADYPMVARNYTDARSRLAKDIGLGKRRRRRPII